MSQLPICTIEITPLPDEEEFKLAKMTQLYADVAVVICQRKVRGGNSPTAFVHIKA